jgi:hypothetical protein
MTTLQKPAFARTVTGEKRSAKVEARVTDSLKFDLQRMCHELGMTESDFIDRLVQVRVYGLEHVQSMERKRIAMVCGLSDEGRTP